MSFVVQDSLNSKDLEIEQHIGCILQFLIWPKLLPENESFFT